MLFFISQQVFSLLGGVDVLTLWSSNVRAQSLITLHLLESRKAPKHKQRLVRNHLVLLETLQKNRFINKRAFF